MKTVFITGCANGIGKYLAEKFLSLHYQVVATDIDFQKLATNQLFQNPHCLIQTLDVSSAENWEKAREAAVLQFKKIDILINNAGVIFPNFLSESTISEIDRHIDINLKGVLYGTKIIADQMIAQGYGHIINFASLAGVAPIEGISYYSASKFGVRGFTLAISREMKQKGIDVSVICPDLVDTQMLTTQLSYQAASMSFSGGKILTVEDIAEAVLTRAIQKKQLEVLIPPHRGILAKFGNSFPVLTDYLTDFFMKKGDKKRLKLKQERIG